MLESVLIKHKNVLQFISEFYHKPFDDLFKVDDNGHDQLINFEITTWDALDNFYDNHCSYFMLLDQKNKEIVGIIKFSETLSPYGFKKSMTNLGGCMYYVEISKKYRGQHLLSTLTDMFAGSYKGKLFISNSETEDGMNANVNQHLDTAFTKKGIKFFYSQEDFLNDYKNNLI